MQDNKIITITLSVLLGIFLQVLLIFGDMQDSPNKAVLEFTKAYFKYDKAGMADRLCKAGDAEMLDKYVSYGEKEARERGFSVWYLGKKLYNPQTYIQSGDYTKATIYLKCEVAPPLRSFFTQESLRHVHQTFEVVKEDGKWKVCGNGSLFAMAD